MGETVCREKGLSKLKLTAPTEPAAPKENRCGFLGPGIAWVYLLWVRGPISFPGMGWGVPRTRWPPSSGSYMGAGGRVWYGKEGGTLRGQHL